MQPLKDALPEVMVIEPTVPCWSSLASFFFRLMAILTVLSSDSWERRQTDRDSSSYMFLKHSYASTSSWVCFLGLGFFFGLALWVWSLQRSNGKLRNPPCGIADEFLERRDFLDVRHSANGKGSSILELIERASA